MEGKYMGPYLGAYRKGCVARRDEIPFKRCPYGDHRTYRGSVTFSRAFIKAWEEGWLDKNHEIVQEKKKRKKKV